MEAACKRGGPSNRSAPLAYGYPKVASSLRVDDETQLLGATTRGHCIFTFNIRDFVALAQQYPNHGAIVLAAQVSWTLSSLIAALDRLLSKIEADQWIGQVRWLNEW